MRELPPDFTTWIRFILDGKGAVCPASIVFWKLTRPWVQNTLQLLSKPSYPFESLMMPSTFRKSLDSLWSCFAYHHGWLFPPSKPIGMVLVLVRSHCSCSHFVIAWLLCLFQDPSSNNTWIIHDNWQYTSHLCKKCCALIVQWDIPESHQSPEGTLLNNHQIVVQCANTTVFA